GIGLETVRGLGKLGFTVVIGSRDVEAFRHGSATAATACKAVQGGETRWEFSSQGGNFCATLQGSCSSPRLAWLRRPGRFLPFPGHPEAFGDLSLRMAQALPWWVTTRPAPNWRTPSSPLTSNSWTNNRRGTGAWRRALGAGGSAPSLAGLTQVSATPKGGTAM